VVQNIFIWLYIKHLKYEPYICQYIKISKKIILNLIKPKKIQIPLVASEILWWFLAVEEIVQSLNLNERIVRQKWLKNNYMRL